jgi:hypothetical protein
MPTSPEAIAADIAEAATAGFRGNLIARGQARAIIWRDGALPADAPPFAAQLSYDLHSYGYALLGLGLRLIELGGDGARARIAFEQAATALESVIAKGDRGEVDRDFHFVMAAASYHLAHLSARAYSLLAVVEADENFSPTERLLALVMRRDFRSFRRTVLDYRASGEGSDERIAQAIQAAMEVAAGDGERDEFLFHGLDTALTDAFMAAMSLFVSAVERGERALVDQAVERLRTGLSVCGELNMLPQWWTHRIAIHFIRDLWSNTFHERVPLQPAGGVAADWSRLRELFIALLQSRPRAEMDLWPSQVDAAGRAVDQIRRSGGLASDQRRKDPDRGALHPSLSRRRQAGGLRHATPRSVCSDGDHSAADLRSARQVDIGALRQHRHQRFRRRRHPRTRHRRRDSGEARLRAPQRSHAA